MKCFPRERFLILIYEDDVERNKERTLQRVFRHLGVNDTFVPPTTGVRYNQRAPHLYMYLNYYFPWKLPRVVRRCLSPLRRMDVPMITLADGEVRELYRLYASENEKLEALLGRSLTIWQPPDRAALSR